MVRPLESASASVLIQHAAHPSVAQGLDAAFGGDGEVMTYQKVKDDFGEKIAGDWASLKRMVDKFSSNIVAQEEDKS